MYFFSLFAFQQYFTEKQGGVFFCLDLQSTDVAVIFYTIKESELAMEHGKERARRGRRKQVTTFYFWIVLLSIFG
jgi:hypothetical protein